ncbi:NAD(P)-dependent oxidoreductase [Pseudoduganella chitinolytica]|uniref:NAD(P)-dependent oxidoreductase n=1 Tax=Pseudoduganella chitinolytica TaxID=34070 RepID=A0ABY8BBR8_9BURK|nr:NAD(P)-dependent oxidoreductase [Pseudoduganella chitinolytica]WEF33347.1 NAD(P)-dependent oxidoreductase [Pseudoduganella chitinolytica]
MNIVLIGATGYVGAKLLDEALARGHAVTAIVTRPEKLAGRAGVTAVQADVQDPTALAAQLRGHDAVISAFSGHAQADVYDYYVRGITAVIGATKAANVPRLLVVGGAGSLEVAPGVQLVDTPAFPAQWKGTAEGARQALNLLRAEPALDWTMLSPAAHLEPGTRTGQFRLGADQLLVDAAGESRISLEDYAVALVDELERPAHRRARFCVAY